MNAFDELFWKIAIPVYAVLFAIIGIELLLLWMLDVFEDEIEWVLSRIPAVQRYRERWQIEHWKECYLRGDMHLTVTHTNPETGEVRQIRKRLLPLGMEENSEPDEVIAAEQLPAQDTVIDPEKEVPDVPAPPA